MAGLDPWRIVPPREGIVAGAGFVAIRFANQPAKQAREAEAGR